MTNHALAFSTLAPIHIGCDEIYEPSNFVIHDGLLHALDPADLANELTDNERRQLAGLAESRDPVGPLQRFFRERAERFSALARHQVAVAPAVADAYQQSAGRPTQRSNDGHATYNVFPMARTAYRPLDNAPYLPGSSLKGSIRTAWLNARNRGEPLSRDVLAERMNRSRRMQERLLGYQAGKFENDPFRHLAVADAHPEDGITPPPTRILYAISKKKRPSERIPQELRVYLETLPEALPASFLGQIRLDPRGPFNWNSLCEACNGFYLPQLNAELNHDILGNLLDPDWKRLIANLIGGELGELVRNRQGFVLRVGRHSGAESVTLDGVRNIKILGPRVEGRPTSEYRPQTTEKRFATLAKSGGKDLLPFGWLWVESCDDRHRHLSDSLRSKLAERSQPFRDDHGDRLIRLEQQACQREAAAAERERQRQAAQAAARAEAEAQAAQAAALAAMSTNARRIEEFRSACSARADQLGSNREKQNADYHSRARKLAQDALEGADWTAEERRAAADAIAEWLPRVVEKIDKDALKKLKLAALRAQTP